MRVKFLITFLTFFLASAAFSQSTVNWLSFEEAQRMKEEEPRKLLVFFETSWCGFCKKMDKSVFADEEVANYLNENFYAIRFDAESKEPITFDEIQYGYDGAYGSRGAHELAKDMLQGYMAYPGVVLLDEEYTSLRILYGLQPRDLFSKFLVYIHENAYENQDWFKWSGQE